MVGVGGAELKVKAALDIGEGVAGADECQVYIVHRRVAPPARISSHDSFGSMEVKGGISSFQQLLALGGFRIREGRGSHYPAKRTRYIGLL